MNCAKYQGVDRKNKTVLGYIVFFVLAFSSLLISCGKGDPEPSHNDHDFIPLRKGWYQVYDVEETNYELGVAQTENYLLKTIVIDSFQNASDGYTYVLQRSRQYDENGEWVPDETWSVRLTSTEAVITRGSIPYVVLVFPSRKGVKWDGNLYNNEIMPGTSSSTDLYEIVDDNVNIEVNGASFNDCVKVVQENNDDPIVYTDMRTETYARGVGLIEREIIQLHYCNDEDRNCVGKQVIDGGTIYKQRILSNGLE